MSWWKRTRDRVAGAASTQRLVQRMNEADAGDVDEVASLVLDLGADAAAVNRKGWTVLHCAARAGRADLALRLVREAGADVDAADRDGATPLSLALAPTAAVSHRDAVATARTLVENGATVTVRDSKGETPLHHAVVMRGTGAKDGGLVALLLERGADADARNALGWTPLHRLLTCPMGQQIKSLIEKRDGRMAPVAKLEATLAEWNAHVEATYRMLADSGTADLNLRSNDGHTPLHLSLTRGYPAVAADLVAARGVDPGAADSTGTTPLHLAADLSDWDTCALLLRAGADVDAKNRFGETALFLAVKRKSAPLVRLLLVEAGADATGDPRLLSEACLGGMDGDVVEALMERGALGGGREAPQDEASSAVAPPPPPEYDSDDDERQQRDREEEEEAPPPTYNELFPASSS